MKVNIQGDFPKVIDSSIRAEFVSCPMKFYYSYIRQLGAPYPSIDLIAGAAFAKGLEVLRRKFYGEGETLENALKAGMLEAIVTYGDVEVPVFKQNKNVERVLEGLAEYVVKWNPKTDHIQPHMVNGKPSVEFSFSIPLPILHPQTREPIIYGGRFDMLGVYNNQLIVVDEKTTSQLGPTWGAKWNLRAQFTGYCYAAQQYGLPVVGAVVRGISFLKNSFGFEENLQLRPDFMIQGWYNQLLIDVTNMVHAYNNQEYSQVFSDPCAEYSGCQFQRLCTTPNPDDWVEGNYVKRIWNPLEKNPEEKVKSLISGVIADPLLNDLIKR